MFDEMIQWRRHLHQYPELSFEEFETTEYIARILGSFGDIVIERPTKTGLVVRIFGLLPGPSPVVGIRGDIDALPIQEETDVPYRSERSGVMHACGHDGHTAMLLMLAKMLVAARASFSGEVRLFFQHAEELPPGGAIEMVRAGAADGVDIMLGIHLSTNLDTGMFGLRDGALTAAVDRFDIEIQGKGGHCAFPAQCHDPIVAASAVVGALQTVVSRSLDAFSPAVVSVCQIHAGSAYNIIPDTATVSGAVRSFGADVRDRIESRIRAVAERTAESYETSATVRYERGYPSIHNDRKLMLTAEDVIRARFGEKAVCHISPIMPGEDFPYFLDGRPGLFVELGSRSAEKHCDMPHHNPLYKLDEDALPYGVRYLYDMTMKLKAEE